MLLIVFIKHFNLKKPSEDILGRLKITSFGRNIADNYSTMVATRPEPTVRPPSRYNKAFLLYFFGILGAKKGWILMFFHGIF